MHEHGKGCKKDINKAFELINKSASGGNPDCLCNLGTLSLLLFLLLLLLLIIEKRYII